MVSSKPQGNWIRAQWDRVVRVISEHWARLAGVTLFGVLVFTEVPSRERLDALSKFAWPVALVAALVLFRHPLSRLIDRLRRGSFWGNTFDTNDPSTEGKAPAVLQAQGIAQFPTPARWLLATL